MNQSMSSAADAASNQCANAAPSEALPEVKASNPHTETSIVPLDVDAKVTHANQANFLEPIVIDISSRHGQVADVQLLGDSGVFVSDEARGAARVAKRCTDALYADCTKEGLSDVLMQQIRELQVKYRPVVKDTPFSELLQSGTLNQLVDEYVSFLVAKSTEKLGRLKEGDLTAGDEMNPALLNLEIDNEQQRLIDLKAEQNVYRAGAAYTKQMLALCEPAIKAGKHMAIGELVIACGFAAVHADDANKMIAKDMVWDVIGAGIAHRMLAMSGRMGGPEYLARLSTRQDDPATQVRVHAIASAIQRATPSLKSLFALEKESPELDRLKALDALVRAQLHEAAGQARSLPHMIEMEKKVQVLMQDYAQTTLSLALDYLGKGAAANAPQMKKVKTNLENEAKRYGVAVLPLADAVSNAERLARISAEDLMQVAQSDMQEKLKVENFARAAGVPITKKPLKAMAYVIGTDLMDVLKPMLDNPNTLVTPTSIIEVLQKKFKDIMAAMPVSSMRVA